MQAIKSLFMTLSLSSDLEKLLVKLESTDDYLHPTDEFVAKVKAALDSKSGQVAVLLHCIQSQNNWISSLKMLYVLHKLIHTPKNLNNSIRQEMLSIPTEVLHDTRLSNLRIQSQCDEVHAPIAVKLFKFQMQICQCYEVVAEAYKYFESEETDYLNSQASQDIVERISPLISALKVIVKVQANLSFALENFGKFEITKQIGLIVIKESIVIFDFIAAVMTSIQDRILSEESTASMRIYAAYEDIVSLNKGIEKMYALRNYMMDPYMRKPRYFKIDKQRNKDIELHVNALRKEVNNSDNVAATVEKSLQSCQVIQISEAKANSYSQSPRKPRTNRNDLSGTETKKLSQVNSTELTEHQKQFATKEGNWELSDHDEVHFLRDGDDDGTADHFRLLSNVPSVNQSRQVPNEQMSAKHGGLSTSNSIIKLTFDQTSNASEGLLIRE